MVLEPFPVALASRGLSLLRGETTILQINMGTLCNQVCRHCHLEAGPTSKDVMDEGTVAEVAAYAARGRFSTADVTGGAPELNPHLAILLESLTAVVPKVILRSNLTAIDDDRTIHLMEFCRERRVVIVASLPAVNAGQTDSVRGRGVWEKSIRTLKKLNSLGYGEEGSGLELHLASNPTGAFLPPSQTRTEEIFRRDLQRKFGISFNSLYTFANVPLGRFRRWLTETGNFDRYMANLASTFNPCTMGGLMCRTLVSVSWKGYLYDCDFNLAAGYYMSGIKMHVSKMDGPPPAGSSIVVSDHCYACTAGSGFT